MATDAANYIVVAASLGILLGYTLIRGGGQRIISVAIIALFLPKPVAVAQAQGEERIVCIDPDTGKSITIAILSAFLGIFVGYTVPRLIQEYREARRGGAIRSLTDVMLDRIRNAAAAQNRGRGQRTLNVALVTLLLVPLALAESQSHPNCKDPTKDKYTPITVLSTLLAVASGLLIFVYTNKRTKKLTSRQISEAAARLMEEIAKAQEAAAAPPQPQAANN